MQMWWLWNIIYHKESKINYWKCYSNIWISFRTILWFTLFNCEITDRGLGIFCHCKDRYSNVRFALVMWEITVGDLGILQELVPQTSSDLKKPCRHRSLQVWKSHGRPKFQWQVRSNWPILPAHKNGISKLKTQHRKSLLAIQCCEKKSRPAEKEIENNCSPLLFFEEQLKRVWWW